MHLQHAQHGANFLLSQPRWTCRTHPLPCFRPPGWGLFCLFWHICAQRTLFVCSSALASQGPHLGPHWHLPFASGCVFDSLEHTKSSVMRHSSCVCIDGILNLQHAEHGARSCLHTHDGRVARTSPHVFNPQQCVCGLFWLVLLLNHIFPLNLHPSRSALFWVHQQKFRSVHVDFVCILKSWAWADAPVIIINNACVASRLRRTALLQQAQGGCQHEL